MTRIPLLVILGLSMMVSVANATALPPCTAAGTMDIIPLSNGHATYCVSDYGWTDTWFVGSSPATYDPRFDVLSGDDSPNLHFGISGGPSWPIVSGFGWLSPLMDVGALTASIDTFSPWMVVAPVHFTGATTAESIILHPTGMEARIVTTLDPVTQQVTQFFTFTNTSIDTTFTDIRFADHFNYHPNGSTAANAQKGTVGYDPLSGITITGIDDGTLIANGSMRGERVDDAHGRNGPMVSSPIDVWDMVQTNTYMDPGSSISPGPGDVAGGLAWDLSDLRPGESAEFRIFKNAEPLSSPEPSSLLLVVLPLAGLVLRQSRKARP